MSSAEPRRVPVSPIGIAVSAALVGTQSAPVLAQDSARALEEIVVTARKREETLLDIPQEIQAIGQHQIERANLQTLDDFARFIPSLSYNSAIPGRGAIYFRGVADNSSSFIADASAAIYLDEQPLTQSSLQPEVRLVDIERIEALPGPQGTLYGASSQSGTLRYITNKPDPTEFTAELNLDASTVTDGEEGYDVSAVVNLPLSENVALRLVGFSARDAGFIDNVFGQSLGGSFDNAELVDEDINQIDYRGGRAALRWFVNEAWTVDTQLVYQHMDAGSLPEDNTLRTGGQERAVVRFRDEHREDEWGQLALTVQGDLGWGQFVSASSYFTRSIDYSFDNTDYTFYLTYAFGANYAQYDLGPDPRGLGWSDTPNVQRFAQEFRLTGGNERWNWLAGLFYERVHDGFDFFSRREDYESSPSFAYWNTYYGVQPGTTDNSFYHARNDLITEQYATFGELSYSPNDRWTFTAGLRWFDHERDRTYFTQQPNGRFSSNLGAAVESTSDVTKKLSVQYNISDDAMVYALFSDGFRAGGRNVVRPGTVLPADYEPDFLDNYELGFKSRWLDGRLALNLTAYHMEWQDYQVEVVDPGPLFAVLIANVGEAEIDGVAVDFSALVWDSLDVGFNLQLLDPEITRDNPIIGTLEGARLPFAPEEKGAAWLEYTFPRQVNGGDIYARVQYTYFGNTLNGVTDPVIVQPAYQITDVSFGYDADSWTLTLYGDNITDERAVLWNQESAPPGNITVNWPRSWGISFTKRWGGN